LADSTYLKLTGGTLTGNLVVNGTTRLIGNVAINTTTAYKPLEVWSNANDFVSVGVKDLNYGEYSGIHFGYVESNSQYRKSAIVFQRTDYSIGDASGKIHFLNVPSFLAGTNASLSYARMTINSNGNVGVNDTLPSSTLSVNGTLGVTGAATLSSTLAVTDAVTLSTTSATPTSLLGKDGSNVVGTVTTVAQTGLMKAGGVTQNTSSVGIISVAHGLSYKPSQVIATLAQQNSYIVVCHDITASDLFFTVYDSVTGNPLNNISVGIFWLAIK
jgi:hypothetical protein